MVTFLHTLVAAVLVLGFLIFVHELGHFLVAKLCGVSVLRFSLGFGPRVLGRQVGETEYVLSLVPLGGYVKMLGEEEGEAAATGIDPSRSFAQQPLFKRFSIVFAGPFFNLASAWACLLVVVAVYGVIQLTEAPRIGGLTHGLPAEKSGLQANDRILAINGKPIATWDELVAATLASQGQELALRVEREGAEVEVRVTPAKQIDKSLFGEELGEVYRLGIERATETKPVPVYEAPWLAAKQVVFYGEMVILSIVKMVQGKVSARELGGPITIARMAGERAQGGLRGLLEFMAFLGVNLGVLNLLPIPVLDGGHLLFFAAEGIFRRPVEMRYREMAQQVGLVLLVSLMLFAVYNDIYRWIEG